MKQRTTRKVLFVTQLEIWSMTMAKSKAGMGNQSMYNTLLGYAGHGYEAHLLTSANQLVDKAQLPENIIVHRHPRAARVAGLGAAWHRLTRCLCPAVAARVVRLCRDQEHGAVPQKSTTLE